MESGEGMRRKGSRKCCKVGSDQGACARRSNPNLWNPSWTWSALSVRNPSTVKHHGCIMIVLPIHVCSLLPLINRSTFLVSGLRPQSLQDAVRWSNTFDGVEASAPSWELLGLFSEEELGVAWTYETTVFSVIGLYQVFCPIACIQVWNTSSGFSWWTSNS